MAAAHPPTDGRAATALAPTAGAAVTKRPVGPGTVGAGPNGGTGLSRPDVDRRAQLMDQPTVTVNGAVTPPELDFAMTRTGFVGGTFPLHRRACRRWCGAVASDVGRAAASGYNGKSLSPGTSLKIVSTDITGAPRLIAVAPIH